MSRLDGRELRSSFEASYDVVVVGSGPAGSAAARELSAAGARVLVIEAGRWFEPHEFELGTFASMSATYRDLGASLTLGAAPTPFVQGKMVGGSSPINGAICWRLPRDVYDDWTREDRALVDALPFEELESVTSELELRLNVKPTNPSIAGRKNELMAKGASALGLEHRPIRRNVKGCEGLGRCMQGCPKGAKLSVDATLLSDALSMGADVLSSTTISGIVVEKGRATSVVGISDGGARIRVHASRAVVVAASAIQSPALLLASGLDRRPIGENFSCHPGVSMAGRFPEPVRMWEGATQGHEVIGLRHEGLKFEALGFGLGVIASRLSGFGKRFAAEVADLDHQLDWGAAIKSDARGRVRLVGKKPVVFYSPSSRDIARYRRGLRVLGEMMLAAGAEHVSPRVRGFTEHTSKLHDLERLEREGPTRGSAYTAVMTHLFGTCRMGSDPRVAVVRPDFRHHDVEQLYVADSSVFPTNTGVNPQLAIMAMATLCARRVLATPSKEQRR